MLNLKARPVRGPAPSPAENDTSDAIDDKGPNRTPLVQIGRYAYAGGLSWYGEPVEKSELANAAKVMASDPDIEADYYLTVPGSRNDSQYALGFKRKGHIPGQRPLALAVMEALGPTWICAVNLGGSRWWFGQASEGSMVPECDVVAYGEDAERQIRAKFSQEMSLLAGSSAKIIVVAPQAWGFDGTDERDIAEITEPSTRIPWLRPVKGAMGWLDALAATSGGSEKSKVKTAPLVGLAVVILIAGVGTWFYQHNQSQKQIAQKRADLARQMQNQTSQPPLPRIAWAGRPLPSALLSECKATVEKLFQEIPGWSIKGLACNGGSAEVSWTNKGGFILNVEQFSTGLGLAPPFLTGDGDIASLSKPLDVERMMRIGVRSEQENGIDLYRAIQLMRDSFRPFRISPSVTQPDASQSAAPGIPPIQWSFNTTLVGIHFGEILDRIPGLEIQGIRFDAQTGRWDLNGIINAGTGN